MSDANDEDYVYDEASGEWISAAAAKTATEADGAVEVRDAVGNLLMEIKCANRSKESTPQFILKTST